jgi:nucleoside-diphosphate-sugar epimerase
MRIDIIGGSGFIGTRLARRLLGTAKYNVRLVDKVRSGTFPDMSEIADVRSDVALMAALRRGSILINLAAEHRDDVTPRSLYDDVNVAGARNICSVARELDAQKIIFTSSVAVYGFAPPGTSEQGAINPFNDYGRTKYEAEVIFREWQAERPHERSLIIIRPTVVFGEQNRGNVYNLLQQIAKRRFVMIGDGRNRKSMAYVENVAAFIEYSLSAKPGTHIYNYVDKPDLTTGELVAQVRHHLGQGNGTGIRIPRKIGLLIGKAFDAASYVTGKSFPISSIRIRKFCTESMYSTAIDELEFDRPVRLSDALLRTIQFEFIEQKREVPLFYTE